VRAARSRGSARFRAAPPDLTHELLQPPRTRGMPLESGAGDGVIGVCIELLGDLLTVVGLTGQRLATLRAEAAAEAEARALGGGAAVRGFRPCYDPHWVVALLVYAMGQVLELVALSYASEPTVVATGTLTLLFNAFASVWVFGEDFAWLPRAPTPNAGLGAARLRALFRDWDGFNLALLVAGSILTVWFSPRVTKEQEEELDARELVRMWFQTPFVYYSFVASATLVVFAVHTCRGPPESDRRPVRLALVLAVLASFSVTMSKVVTELFSRTSEGEDGQFSSVGSVVMLALWLASLVLQLVILNVGLRDYEQSVFVPLSETLGASLTILAGILYFRTYRDFDGPHSVAGFLLGVLVLVVGLFFSARRQSASKAEIRERLARRPSSSPRFSSAALTAPSFHRSSSLRAYAGPVSLDAPLLPLDRQPPLAGAAAAALPNAAAAAHGGILVPSGHGVAGYSIAER